MALFGFGRKKKDAAPCCTSCGEACAAHEGEKAGRAHAAEIRRVQVLGGGCASCHTLFENTKRAAGRMGLSVEVEYITDLQQVMSYGEMRMPVLAVNDKVVCAGRVPSAPEVEALLRAARG